MILRHEINVINGTNSLGLSFGAKVQLDTTKYSGTCTYYFEVYISASSSGNVRLVSGASGASISTASTGLVRSSSFTPVSGAAEYYCDLSASTATIKSARIIIIQDTGTSVLTSSESQFEIGNQETGITVTSTGTLQKLSAPKYWKYEAANFDGTCTFYGEVTYIVSSTTGNKTIVIQEATSAEPTATWTTVATMLSAATGVTTTTTRLRSSSFTPVDGRYYRLAWTNSSTMSTISIYNGKIIVDQTGVNDTYSPGSVAATTSLSGVGGTNEKVAQSFTASSDYNLSAFAFAMVKANSPTDNLVVKIYSGSVGGTLLGTSSEIVGSSLGTSTPSSPNVTFYFSSAIALTNGTKYYAVVERTGSRDTTNRYSVYNNTTGYSGGGLLTVDSGVTSSESATADNLFSALIAVTKTEEHYLLANTILAAGTALQNFLTKWDDTEWSGVTNTYIHQVDAGDNNTSVVELDGITSGSAVTNSSVSSPDNYKQSTSALTMPSNQNLDVKATTNSGSVFGSRVIVKSVKTVIASIPNKIYSINQSINRASTY